MKKVYVAGKLNGMACDYITNVHRMIEQAERVRKAGFAVFIPGIDLLMGVVIGDWNYKDYFNNSQPWLAASDAVFVTPGWEKSEGTKREIKYAASLGIPIYYDLNTMLKELNDTR